MAAIPIAIRLEREVVAEIDALVDSDDAPTRTEFIREAIAAALERARQLRIDRELIEAWTQMPETEDERADVVKASLLWAGQLDDEDW